MLFRLGSMNTKRMTGIFLPLLITATLASPTGAYAATVVAKIGSSPLGKIVVNGKGMTAYYFDLDKAHSGVSACSGSCAVLWPAIMSTTVKPTVSGISGAVGTISIKGGKHQVTISGRPIYTYAPDKAPGQVKGQGVAGVWYVISPKGTEIKVLKLASKSTPTPTATKTYPSSRY